MAHKHMNMYSTSLVISEVQLKTKRKYHFPPTRMAKIKRLTAQNVGNDVE